MTSQKHFHVDALSRASFSKLSAHTMFHYSENWAATPLWAVEELQPVTICNIKISACFLSTEEIHMLCNADAFLTTDDVKLHKALS